jgi:hypothetical protein
MCWQFFQIHVLPRSLSLLCVCLNILSKKGMWNHSAWSAYAVFARTSTLVARVTQCNVAGWNEPQRKIPGPPEEYWYRDIKKETSSSSSSSNNNDDDDDDENNSCYNNGINEIPYLS